MNEELIRIIEKADQQLASGYRVTLFTGEQRALVDAVRRIPEYEANAAGWEESCAEARAERDAALSHLERLRRSVVALDRGITCDRNTVVVPRDQYLAVVAEAYA